MYMMVSDLNGFGADECNVTAPPDSPTETFKPCADKRLYLGFEIPRLNVSDNWGDAKGTLTLLLDTNRSETLLPLVAALKPRNEDRRIILTFNSGTGEIVVSQERGDGNGGWVALSSSNQQFKTVAVIKAPAGQSHAHLEVSVRLGPDSSSSAEPLLTGSRVLGLAAMIRPMSGAFPIPGVTVNYPNVPNTNPNAAQTAGWETLDFRAPTPLPLTMSIWNVGQMTDVGPSDGGSGEIDTIAAAIYKRQAVCLTEIWMAHERVEIVETVNAFRAVEGLPPIYSLTDDDDEVLEVGGYTGLVFLSSLPIIDGGVHHFDEDNCTGLDCWQSKGVIWARVGLKPDPTPAASTVIPQANDYAQFVDLFCTHVNAGDEDDGSEDTTERQIQFKDIAAYVNQVRKGGPLSESEAAYRVQDKDIFPKGTWPSSLDRPAFLLGDLNTTGPKGNENDLGYKLYRMMTSATYLETDQVDAFAKANSTTSDVTDLGWKVSGPDPSLAGTWLTGNCNPTVQAELGGMSRLDYVLVYPPRASAGFPSFLLQSHSSTVDAHYDPASALDPMGHPMEPKCLSDHAEVRVDVNIVRASDVLKYNAKKKHEVTYAIKTVTDLEDDDGCCADFFTTRIFMASGSTGQVNSWPTVIEGSTVHPNWFVHTGSPQLPHLAAGFAGTVRATGAVWEDDSGGNDHYDSIWEGGDSHDVDDKDAHFRFDAATGDVFTVQGEVPVSDWGINKVWLGSFLNGFEDGMTYETTGNNGDGNNNARVRHYFHVKEIE